MRSVSARTERGRARAIASSALARLAALDTSPAGTGHLRCCTDLADVLRNLGFEVAHRASSGRPPVLVASRRSTGLGGHVAFYNHYDTEAPGTAGLPLTQRDGRLYGLGVADNKGPLACRLAALESIDRTPAITWLIQGEEETGSTIAHQLFPDIMRRLQPTIWLDETGYHDHEDGTLRLIACTTGADGKPSATDQSLDNLLDRLRKLAQQQHGISARNELRHLNKHLVKNGCPFQASLPAGSRYIALGINDSRSSIHSAEESVPLWTFDLHAAELEVLFEWVHDTAGAE